MVYPDRANYHFPKNEIWIHTKRCNVCHAGIAVLSDHRFFHLDGRKHCNISRGLEVRISTCRMEDGLLAQNFIMVIARDRKHHHRWTTETPQGVKTVRENSHVRQNIFPFCSSSGVTIRGWFTLWGMGRVATRPNMINGCGAAYSIMRWFFLLNNYLPSRAPCPLLSQCVCF